VVTHEQIDEEDGLGTLSSHIVMQMNLADNKVLQQHPLMRNCLLLQDKLLHATSAKQNLYQGEAEIKVQACRVLNKIFDLR
jgi:hypothetical protein